MPPAGRPANCEPSTAGRSWKGGARERADDVFFCHGHKKTSEQSGLCSDVEYRNTIDANASRFSPKAKSKPSAAGSIWKGGARERADDVFFCHRHKKTSEQSGLCSDVVPVVGLEPTRCCHQRILSPSRLPIPSYRQIRSLLYMTAAGLARGGEENVKIPYHFVGRCGMIYPVSTHSHKGVIL